MHYSAILNRGSHFEVFKERESFTLVCLRIIKHGDPVGDQRIMGLFYYLYSNKLCLSSKSNVLFPLRLLLALLICVSQGKT